MNSETIVLAISVAVSLYAIFACLSYMRTLHADIVSGKYVFGEELHSLQHFATAGAMALVSVLLLSEAVFHANFPMQFVVTLAYNGMVSTMILPHLVSEK